MVVKTAPAKGSTSTKVVTRPQTLPNEILLDVLKYADRRWLDNMYLMRRFVPLLDHCDQLRTVSEAYFSYSSSTFTHSVVFAIKVKTKKRRSFEWMPPTIVKKTFYADVSVDTKSLKRAVDVFTKALLHSHITGEVRFENVELSRYFVTQMKNIANRYIIDDNSLIVRGVLLKLDVSPMDFITAFGILHELNRSAAEWFDFVGLDDRVLKHFATQGILKLSQCEVRRTSVDGRHWWDCRRLSEDALIDFAFNDAYGSTGLRYLRGQNCQLSPMFLRKLVQARRESSGTYQACLRLITDDKVPVEQNLDGLRQFQLRDDDEDTWEFEFPDIPNFRVEYYGAFEAGRIDCWSNLAGDEHNY